jgi:RNA polymerase sigma-70 factor (ECF subfamily)
LQNHDDAAAWDEFVGLYGPVVYRVARGRGFQAADADNLVQEVLFAVAQSVSQWLERADRGSFRAWLLRIARNEAADTISRRATRPLGRDGDAAARVLSHLPARDDISSRLDLEYERTVFQWAADKVRSTVASHTWQAFWLTHVDGHSIEEAAKQLQTRPGNIYFGRSRVMARIKELVHKYEDSQ